MPRTFEYRRFNYAGLIDDRYQYQNLTTLAPGETIVRTRMTLKLSTLYTQPFLTASVGIVVGLAVDLADSGPGQDLFTGADGPYWLWWENFALTSSPLTFTSGSDTYYTEYTPAPGLEIDSKAQRAFLGPDELFYYCAVGIDPLLTVGELFVQMSGSVGVLGAPE